MASQMCLIYEHVLCVLLFEYETYSVVIMYEMSIRKFYSWFLCVGNCSCKYLTFILLILKCGAGEGWKRSVGLIM